MDGSINLDDNSPEGKQYGRLETGVLILQLYPPVLVHVWWRVEKENPIRESAEFSWREEKEELGVYIYHYVTPGGISHIKSRQKPSFPIDSCARSHTLTHIGRLYRRLQIYVLSPPEALITS